MSNKSIFMSFSLYGDAAIFLILRKTASFILAVFLLLSLWPISNASAGTIVSTSSGEVNLSETGVISGAPDVDAQSGAYTYSLPVVVPPGRNGLVPQTALNYSSSNRQQGSVFGYGWSFPLFKISRINKTGVNNLHITQEFTSDLDGELLTTDGRHFGAEFDDGSFRDYEFNGGHWVVIDKEGTRYSFGSSTNSQFVDMGSTTRIHSWYIDEIRDTNDNYIKYTYEKENNAVYPKSIIYTGHGSSDGLYSVNFTREIRPDVSVTAVGGFVATTSERISEIRIDVDGTWVRKYELNYGFGENGNRSLLTSVTESGQGDKGVIVLPSVDFEYSNIATSSQGWSDNNSYSVPHRIVTGHEGHDQGVRFMDVNGDGYADLTRFRNGNITNQSSGNVSQEIYLNTGSEFVATTTWSFPDPGNYLGFSVIEAFAVQKDTGARFADVNGDGFTDILWAIDHSFNGGPSGIEFQRTYINNQVDGWDEDTSWEIPSDVYFMGSQSYNDTDSLIVDVNGDGLPDIVKTGKTYLNTGEGWEEAGDEWDSPVTIEAYDRTNGAQFVELNGDGLVDIVRHFDDDYHPGSDPDESVNVAYLNTGAGWELNSSWNLPIPLRTQTSQAGGHVNHAVRLIDVNGDGLTDIFAHATGNNIGQQDIYINTGEGWDEETNSWSLHDSTLLSYQYNQLQVNDTGTRLIDFDGDNMIDFAKYGPENDNYPNNPIHINEIITHKGDVPDLLTKITTKEGGTISTEYKQSAQYKKDGKLSNGTIAMNLDTVSKVTETGGFGDTKITKFFYEDGHYFFGSSTNRQFAGFGKVSVATDFGTTTTFYHQGNNDDNSSSEVGDTEAKIGRAYQIEVLDTSNSVFKRTRNSWGTANSTEGVFVQLRSVLDMSYDGDSSHKDSATEYTYHSNHGSILTEVEYGEVSGNVDGTFTDIDSDKRTTVYEYATSSLTDWGVGGPGADLLLLENELGLNTIEPNLKPAQEKDVNEMTGTELVNHLGSVSGRERADIKGKEIAKVIKRGEFSNQKQNTNFEIVDFDEIPGGIQIFARVWKNGQQLGYGSDGSVDIERFRFYNPPLLVPDENGEIVRRVTDTDGTEHVLKLRFDPEAAIHDALTHTAALTGKTEARIKRHKIGNTTSTFYPDADPETETVDGYLQMSNLTNWDFAHDQNPSQFAIDDAGVWGVRAGSQRGSSGHYIISRGIVLFDTSPLSPHTVIESATLSLYADKVDDDDNDAQSYITVVQVQGDQLNSDTSLSTSDAFVVGDALQNPTEGIDSSNRLDITNAITGAYNNFTLNSTGMSWIARETEQSPVGASAGITYLGLREGHDVEDVIYDNPIDSESRILFSAADIAGTTESPKLIVQHSIPTTTSSGWGDGHAQLVVPSKVTLIDSASTTVREEKLYYDNQPHGSVTDGNLTKREDWVNGSTYVDTEWSYNSYGLVTSETDPRNNVTNFGYDTYNLFVASTTNALGHTVNVDFDYSSGQAATTTDQNGEVYVTTYDGLDRPLEEKSPNPQTGTTETVTEYVYTDTAGAVSVQQKNHLDSSTINNMYTYLDGFGRTIQERIEAEVSNEYVVRDFVYADNGLLEKESLPYFNPGTARSTTTTDTDLYSTYTYDALERVTRVATAVGNTDTAYDQWQETVTDAENNDKDFTYDAYGRLVQVTEHEGSSTYDTDYTYDVLDNLTKISDSAGNEREIEYDGLSRRITLEDLHDATESSPGEWTFGYDASGNLDTTTDPNSQTINYTYDALNRVLTEDFTGQSGTEVTYNYDSCTEGIGFLCSADNGDADTDFTYTKNGLVKSEVREIDATTYTTSYEYDRQGNQTKITYPDNSEVRYTYNKGNQLEQVEQKESGGSFDEVIKDFDYGPHGLVTTQVFGNGATTTKTYDADNLYRLTNIQTLATSNFGTGSGGEELLLLENELGLNDSLLEEVVIETTEEAFVVEVIEVPELPVAAIEPEPVPVVAGTSSETVAEENESEATVETEVPATTTDAVVATSTDTIIEDNATTTEPIASTTESVATNTPEIVFEVVATTTDPIHELEPVLETAVSTPTSSPEATEVQKEERIKKPKQKLNTKDHVRNVQDAKFWQKYHRERVKGIERELGTSSPAYQNAIDAYEEYELQLIDAKYLEKRGGEVKGTNLDWVRGKSKKGLRNIISFIMPEQVHAYLFGEEDFESCSSLPCSFDQVGGWGSATASLDSSGKVSGDDSVEFAVTGAGARLLEFDNQNEDEIYLQFEVYIPSNMNWGTSGYYSMLSLENSSENTIFSMQLEDWSGDARLTLNGDPFSWTNTNVNLTEGAVNTVEVRFKVGSSNGEVEVWVDNTTEGSSDYSSGSTNTGTANVDDIRVGISYAPNAVDTTYYDNIVYDTAFIGSGSTGGGGSSSTPTTAIFREVVQDLSYAYDAVGNITQIVDNSDTDSSATTTYAYDDLYRLTSASTAGASTTPYSRTYSYDAIGNITNKSDQGAYTYGTGGGSAPAEHVIYDDARAGGWDDWSWGTNRDYSSTAYVNNGTYALEVEYTSQWTGLQLRNGSIDTSSYDDLTFDIYLESGSNWDMKVRSYNKDNNNQLGQENLFDHLPSGWTTGTWQSVDIPLSDIGFDNFNGNGAIVIQSDGSSNVTIHLDDIKLVEAGSGGGGGTGGHPHAVTQIGSDTFTYDANGNLTSDSTGLSNTWDYLNRLTQSVQNGTTTYLYDHTGQRVQKDNGTTETIYANSLYEEKGATTTKHIYANDMLVATVEEDTPAPKVYYNHLDHLNSTNAVTSDDGYINQLLAYYPFGDGRIDEQYTSIDQTSRYTGYKHDEETGLSYAGARYQSGEQGRFVSQDPVALAIGNQPLMDSMTNMDLTAYLRKPQLHNSYSYAGNNPIKYIDKNGEFVFLAVPAAVYVAAEIGFTAYDVYDMVKTLSDANSSNVDRSLSVGGVALGLVLPGGGYGAGAKVTKNLTTGSLRTASNVNVTEKGFNHVLSRHTINGAEFTAGNTSYFNNADEIGDLIKSVNGQKGVVQPNGNIARTIQLDKNIGYDAVTKSDTNVMTVVTKQNGDLVTAHPGSPRKSPKTEN